MESKLANEAERALIEATQRVWVSAYGEWRELAQQDDDGALISVMLGRDENGVRLRQAMPFVGLLRPQGLVAR